MPDVLLFLIGALIGIFGLCFAVVGLQDGDKKLIFGGLLILLLAGSVIAWPVAALNADQAVLYTETAEIKSVVSNDGSVKQFAMFTSNANDPLDTVDVTKQFARSYPEGTKVVRTHKSPWKYGIYIVSGQYWTYSINVAEGKTN